jgi:hypothetical protein
MGPVVRGKRQPSRLAVDDPCVTKSVVKPQFLISVSVKSRVKKALIARIAQFPDFNP